MPRYYSSEELTEMIIAYGRAGENANRAAEIYAEQFPGRAHYPCNRTILRVVQRLRQTGCFVHNINNAPARVPVENQERILHLFEDQPDMSIRRASYQLNLSRYRIHHTLRQNALHPFHYQRVQQLLPRDFEPRVYFCEGFLAQSRRDASFPDSILWTDESTFTPNGVINLRNRLYWSDENPHVIRQGAFQYRWSINVWAGLIDNHVIGPYFLPPRLTGEFYEYFLDTELPGLLENIPLATRRNMIYQHDGAPAHWSRGVRRLLDARFRDRWIGRGGPIIWPPRSPDLTPLDYFLWGHIKNLVEPQRNGTVNEVREAIVAAFATITPHMVYQATQDVVRRARLCVQQRGGHFEQFLN
ncbi:histone-lysine N-methyltransferase SETMAR-like [Cardiocondyla obscurior]|uniref:histone-lysine N-methyltransferase SETMAR-like n=1 Tax=Cardiocondyla obscurior TaxID=286306 RepID=UPI0039656E48